MTESPLFSVGQIASRTGLTVRALHHYEALGLLAPVRTEAGHRRYGPAEVERLQQIRSLQSLGVPLREIGGLLAAPDFDPAGLVARQREALATEAARLGAAMDRLGALERSLRRRAETGDPVDSATFLQTLRAMHEIEQHYTPEQLQHLADRREAIGEETIRNVEAEWPRLFEALGRELDAGTDPSASSVQALVDRWDELVAMFTGGDAGITRSLGSVWKNSGDRASQMTGLDPDRMRDLFAYAHRAREARD